MEPKNRETFEFKSEAKQLLEMMIHSIYSTKDVFLRELISNASDAIDRLRFEALTDKNLLPDTTPEIRIFADSELRTLTIEDNGIGMSRDELISELGTIARSGTKEFTKKIKEAHTDEQLADLIGQFGVGFYSAFIVSSKVTVVSKRADSDEAFGFESTGDGTFHIFDAERTDAGTSVTLHLLDADPENKLLDYTESWATRQTITKYSDFIQHPILLQNITEKDGKEVVEWETVNSMKAIWTRPQSEVEDKEYAEFYKHISHDWTQPLETLWTKAEGTFEYYSLLFIPSKPPFDLYYRDGRFGLRLHVNRVLIKEDCKDILPEYLRFVTGVIDSPDLSLNVSREVLQQDRRVGWIKKRLTKKILDTLEYMQEEDAEKYAKFWIAFGRVIKEGIVTDYDNQERLKKLLWFDSSMTAEPDEGVENEDDNKVDQFTSLDGYISRMGDDQEEIYYLTGESRSKLEKSPLLENFFTHGYEVIYLTDHYDEIMLGSLTEYEGKKLKSVGKGDIELGSEEDKKKQKEDLQEKEVENASLLAFLKNELEQHIKEVRLSLRLTHSAACLVDEEGDYSPHFERLLKQAGQSMLKDRKRILEINPEHSLIEKMQERYNEDPEDMMLGNLAQLLYGQALLAEGSPLPDPVAFSQQVADLMVDAL